MSTEAMKWAMEYAPPMPSQVVSVLLGLAYHADSRGKGAHPSVDRLAAYTGKDKRQVQRDLKKLAELGLIRPGDPSKAEYLPFGKRPDVYDLAVEKTVKGGRAGRDGVTRASRVALASSRRRGGKKKPMSEALPAPGTGDVHVTPDADVTRDVHVAEGVTSTSQEGRRPRHPNQLPEPKDEPKDSLRVREQLEAFGAFWLIYPKKRDREAAKTAWLAALDRGADPQRIVDAATAYARERTNEDPRFTKFPATWLNKGCYDDEPDPAGRPPLRAVGPQTAPRDMTEEEMTRALQFG